MLLQRIAPHLVLVLDHQQIVGHQVELPYHILVRPLDLSGLAVDAVKALAGVNDVVVGAYEDGIELQILLVVVVLPLVRPDEGPVLVNADDRLVAEDDEMPAAIFGPQDTTRIRPGRRRRRPEAAESALFTLTAQALSPAAWS